MSEQTEQAKKMQDRADKLADMLIESFGYTDAQLVASLTMAAIGKKLIDDKLNGDYVEPSESELAVNQQPFESTTETGVSCETKTK